MKASPSTPSSGATCKAFVFVVLVKNMLIQLFVFILGLLVGSFLNCVIYRMEHKKSFLKGRSFCPKCKHILSSQDLVPLLSFIVLRGKCRYCHRRISFQYPFVELFTGIVFLLIFNFYFRTLCVRLDDFLFLLPTTIISNQFLIFNFYLLIFSLLIVIFVFDLKHYIIPDKIVYPAIGVVILFLILKSLILNLKSFWPFLGTAMGVSFLFFLIWFFSKGRAIGFGDVKLAFLLGLLLGWPNILVGMMLAFFSGSLVGLGLIIARKKKMSSQVPFGPFLIAGSFVALLWGSQIWAWYISLIQ